MQNLRTIEIKAFVPATDFAVSKQFYLELGFSLRSEGGGIAYFLHGECSYLLQDCDADASVSPIAMHLLVDDVSAWHAAIEAAGIAGRYAVEVTQIVQQPWRMRDFLVTDPSGNEWRIAQNTD